MPIKPPKLPDSVHVKLTLNPELHQALQEYVEIYRETYGQSECEPVTEILPYIIQHYLDSDIRRATRKKYSAEEKIRIVLPGLRGEYSISELCRREGIAESLYYSWSKEVLEAGKRRLAG